MIGNSGIKDDVMKIDVRFVDETVWLAQRRNWFSLFKRVRLMLILFGAAIFDIVEEIEDARQKCA